MKNSLLFPLLLCAALSTGCGSLRRDFVALADTPTANQELPADIVPNNAFLQLDLQVPVAPTSVPSNGKNYLVYELFISNLIPLDYQLEKLEVIDADSNQVVSTLSGAELRKEIRLGSTIPTPAGTEPVTLTKGERSTVFFFLEFPNAASVPHHLRHRLTVNDGQTQQILNDEEIITVAQTVPTVLAPPVTGGPWKCDGAMGADTALSYHRTALLGVNGKARIAQRYAIDLELRTPSGDTFSGDPSVNSNYPCYGKPILASHAGTVVKVLDGAPDNTPPNVPSPPYATTDAPGGNGVILDIGNGLYLVHGHMQPGSIPADITVGATVTVGQLLGKIGNSGNSFEPHLHIHVCDKPSFVASQGMPFVFSSFNLIEGAVSTPRTNEHPLLNETIEFP